jgi:hypothetical protein
MPYELSGVPHLIDRWRWALHTALVEAARTGQAVTITRRTRDGTQRDLRGTVFPDGQFVSHLPLHRTPRGFGL